MLAYALPDLSIENQHRLQHLQERVDQEVTRGARIALATSLFTGKAPVALFAEIRAILGANAPLKESCYYCERDRYREIEHVYPKRHYPELAFVWTNYVYSCTICNQDAKKDSFAVVTAGGVVNFDRKWPQDRAPPVGDVLMINPRTEDPMVYLHLDLSSGDFVPHPGLDGLSKMKAVFTRDLFRLNDPSLTRVRRQASKSYTDLLEDLIETREEVDDDRAVRILLEINELPQPTVWAEIVRQAPGRSRQNLLVQNFLSAVIRLQQRLN